MYDICIIGGGAAGLCCAISSGKQGKKVLLLEKNNKLGKKLYATGNGKCNLTNLNFCVDKHYNSSDLNYVQFINDSLYNAFSESEPNSQIIELMEMVGINTTNDNNYIYPSSGQASSVVWALLDQLNKYNIEIRLNTEVLSIEGKYPSFLIKCKNKSFKATNVVLSNGGSAYKSLGGCPSGYMLSQKFGHNIISPRPSLCGLKVLQNTEDIAGVRANSRITLIDNSDKVICESSGELQLTKHGLSGICIFEISSKVGRLFENGDKPKVFISFFENEKCYKKLKNEIKNGFHSNRTAIGILNGYVNDKLALYACKIHNIDGKSKVSNYSYEDLYSVVDTLNQMEFNIKSLYDIEQAQVTAGGVNINEINPHNMESKLIRGLYIVGELLDVDGICGGYNLTFAMLTGYKAGKSLYDTN